MSDPERPERPQRVSRLSDQLREDGEERRLEQRRHDGVWWVWGGK